MSLLNFGTSTASYSRTHTDHIDTTSIERQSVSETVCDLSYIYIYIDSNHKYISLPNYFSLFIVMFTSRIAFHFTYVFVPFPIDEILTLGKWMIFPWIIAHISFCLAWCLDFACRWRSLIYNQAFGWKLFRYHLKWQMVIKLICPVTAINLP